MPATDHVPPPTIVRRDELGLCPAAPARPGIDPLLGNPEVRRVHPTFGWAVFPAQSRLFQRPAPEGRSRCAFILTKGEL